MNLQTSETSYPATDLYYSIINDYYIILYCKIASYFSVFELLVLFLHFYNLNYAKLFEQSENFNNSDRIMQIPQPPASPPRNKKRNVDNLYDCLRFLCSKILNLHYFVSSSTIRLSASLEWV